MRLFKSLFIITLISLTGCSSIDQSGNDGYHWEVNRDKMRTVERQANRSTSKIHMVWVNPPRVKVKHSEKN